MGKYKLTKKEVTKKQEKELSDFTDLEKKLLVKIGIKNKKEANDFFNPSYEDHTHSPFLMLDMERAVSRTLKAIENNEKIVIYTDYDCDGISAGVILKDFFEEIDFSNFENYIPHRHEEGYGLNKEAIEEISKKGTNFLITADCGSSDFEAVELANKLGLEVLITDHHELPEEEPPAFAILNPKRKKCAYPDKNISGAVVVFKFIQGLIEKGDFKLTKGKEKWLLDLIGVSVIADMVPLTGENRVFARFGLLVIRKSRREGLKEILNKMKINKKFISEDDISFMIAPRINACSRMDSPKKAFNLLSTKDREKAENLAEEIQKINDKRKGVVASMIKEIRAKIEAKEKSHPVLVTGNPKWKPALLGLVANTLIKEYGKPVFLWGREGNGILKGSCRSDGSIDVGELMKEAGDELLGYGGHKFAGGFSVSFEKVHSLEEKFAKAYKKISSKKIDEEKEVDEILDISEVKKQTTDILDRFAPFGEGNPKPIFLFKNVKVLSIKKFGKDGAHLSISFENGNGSVRGLKFFYEESDFEKNPKKGDMVDVIGSIERSFFAGSFEIRIRILDLV